MEENDDSDLTLEPSLQLRAEAEIGEPSSIEGKRAKVAELRELIAQGGCEGGDRRLGETSSRNLIRFLRLSKFDCARAFERIKDYRNFFHNNRDVDNLDPENEFREAFKDLIHVYHDLPGAEGRVVLCLFPKLALARITPEMVKQNPRILLRANVWMFDRLSFDTKVQVCGIIIFNSFSDFGTHRTKNPTISLSQLVNIKERRLTFNFFSILGFRLKVAMVFEEPYFLTWFWFVIKQFVKSKIRERFMLNGPDYAKIDEIFPQELRRSLPEPLCSLGTSQLQAPVPINDSWFLREISAEASERKQKSDLSKF